MFKDMLKPYSDGFYVGRRLSVVVLVVGLIASVALAGHSKKATANGFIYGLAAAVVARRFDK